MNEQFFADQKIGRIDLQICPLRVDSHSIPPTLREFFAWFVYSPSNNAGWAEMKRMDEQQRSEPLTDEWGNCLGQKIRRRT